MQFGMMQRRTGKIPSESQRGAWYTAAPHPNQAAITIATLANGLEPARARDVRTYWQLATHGVMRINASFHAVRADADELADGVTATGRPHLLAFSQSQTSFEPTSRTREVEPSSGPTSARPRLPSDTQSQARASRIFTRSSVAVTPPRRE